MNNYFSLSHTNYTRGNIYKLDKFCNCIYLSHTHYTSSNIYKLDKFRVKLDVRKFFYAYRIVNVWNSLNTRVIACTIINIFVKNLKNVNMDNYLKGQAFKLACYVHDLSYIYAK